MFVIVAKVKGTQKASAKIAKKIDQVLNNMNKKYSEDLFENFKRVNQISFEGVLEKGIYVFEVVDKLKFSLSEYDMVFGVGFAETILRRNDQRAVLVSGKLYEHHALGTSAFIESRWRQSQVELVKYLVLTYGFMENFIQKDVAKVLKLSPQNFNQQLKNSGYFNILKLKREMTVVLEQYRRAAYQIR